MNGPTAIESEALPELPGFAALLDSYQKFGWRCKASKDDLPALREYRDNLARNITRDLFDTHSFLGCCEREVHGYDGILQAEGVGYALEHAAERILALAEIGCSVSRKIIELEANEAAGEAS